LTFDQQRQRVEEVKEIKGITKVGRKTYDESRLRIFSPLLISLRLCGLYFRRPLHQERSDVTITGTSSSMGNCNHGDEYNGTGTLRSGVSWKPLEMVSAAYSFIVTFILWINAVRISTVIAPNNNTTLLFTKFEYPFFYSEVAILQTVFFCASFSGILDRVLAEASQLGSSSMFDAHFRKVIPIITAGTWLIFTVNLSLDVYSMFFSGGMNDWVLTSLYDWMSSGSNTIVRP
jgi:hypothetical protein